MEPLLDDHLIDGFAAVVVLFVPGLELPPLGILQFDNAVADSGGNDGHEAEQETGVDVGHFAAGEVVVSRQEVARSQRGRVQLRRLRAGIRFAEEEDVLLDLSVAHVQSGADDVVERDAPHVLDLGRREHPVARVLEPTKRHFKKNYNN